MARLRLIVYDLASMDCRLTVAPKAVLFDTILINEGSVATGPVTAHGLARSASLAHRDVSGGELTALGSFGHNVAMRTTVTLDDDILELAKRHARLRRQSLGRTLSELVRRGLNAPTPAQEEDGLVVFRLPADSPIVTTETVRRLEIEGG